MLIGTNIHQFLLNQARVAEGCASGFLKLLWFAHQCVYVFLCVCLSVCLLPKALITSGMIGVI